MPSRNRESQLELHELLTCLAVIRGHVQLARRGVISRRLEPEVITRSLDIAVQQVDLVTSLLSPLAGDSPMKETEDQIVG